MLRSESNRKVGEAYLAIASGEDSAALLEARAHLFKAQEDLLNLRHKNELGKNYEHRLALIAADLDKTVPRKD